VVLSAISSVRRPLIGYARRTIPPLIGRETLTSVVIDSCFSKQTVRQSSDSL